jgi:c-di-GMP-related signal transduction protein
MESAMSITVDTPGQTTESGQQVFLGRQPILDRARNVFGYELLYRSSGQHNAYSGTDADQASSAVLHRSLNVVGLNELVGPHRAFVNFTRNLLVNGDWTVLPKESIVVELLETVEPDAEVVSACRAVKEAGYVLALDDFVFSPKYEVLLQLADILKIDFLLTRGEERKRIAAKFGGRLELLAEKVETHEDFRQGRELGFRYFQGYFFCKPEIISQREIPVLKQHALHFIQEINAPEVDFERVEQIIKRDMALATRLLRYLNSASVGLGNRITSIRHALTLLGQRPLRKWASLIAMSAFGKDKPSELMTIALVRGRFCEQVGSLVGMKNREMDLFFMGLFSAMDALLDQPLDKLLARLPLPEDVAAALTGTASRLGVLYALALAYEQGRDEDVNRLNASLGLTLEELSEIYRQAVVWADESRKM